MLYISHTPVQFKTASVLHLVHPSDRRNPEVLDALRLVKCDSQQVAYLGEHFLSDSRFLHADSVILYGTTQPRLKDMLKRLQQGGYAKRFLSLKQDTRRSLFVYGNAVKLLPKKLLLIPKDNPAIASAIPGVSKIDISTAGLGVIDIMLDIPFDISSMGDKYTRVLQLLSKQFPVFLLDSRVLYSSDGTAKFGDMYRMESGVLTKIKELPLELKEGEEEVVRQRKVSPMRVIYAKETESEKKEDALGTSEAVKQIDEKHSI